MSHWKLTLAYDGTPFRGWQIQPTLPTVQGLLADAIYRTVGERVLPQGSGRTDAGVHALGQVASFTVAAAIPAANLHNALNRCLPPSIRVLRVEVVPPEFHARHSALRKTYEYRIFPAHASSHRPRTPDLEPGHDPICPPILAPYVWACPWPLDLAALNQAAAQVVGTHDFTSFAASDPDLTTREAAEPGSSLNPLRSNEVEVLEDAEEGSLGVEMRMHIPGAKARIPSGAVMPGLKSRPISETSFSAASFGPGSGSSRETHAPHTNIRTITCSAWHAHEGLLIYRVTANGFLHHMVRNLVGTFVQCGARRLSPDSIPTVLAARNRSAAGPTAPPTGLFLLDVEYRDPEPSTSNLEPEL